MSNKLIRNLTKNIFIYVGFSFLILLLFNLYIFQNNRTNYSTLQENFANSTMRVLEATIELPLLVANNLEIEDILNKLELDSKTVRIDIYDNKETLVASRINEVNLGSDNIIEYHKDVYNGEASSTQDIFGDESFKIEPQKIGTIKVEMRGYKGFKDFSSESIVYLYNAIFIGILLVVGIWIYFRLKQTSRSINSISRFLDGEHEKSKPLSKFKEFNGLYSSVSNAVEKISKQEIQLTNLRQEIQYAREDSNLELNRFLDFLMASDLIKFDDNLKVFVDAVLFDIKDKKSLVNVPRILSKNIAQHSELLYKYNVSIFENILGKLQDCSVSMNKFIFEQFMHLFIEQVIMLCENFEVKINADINKLHGDSYILRLSFESSSPAFKETFEHQALFDFIASPEISIDTNNASFIACKHLLHKAGGDYIYLENEIRFEFPVLIEKNTVSATSLSLIKPLEIQRSLLVFDSDPTERIALMGYLDKFAQKADKATTKQVSLQKIRQNKYDIICVNSDFFSSRDPYFLTNFKSEYLALENRPLLLVISSKKEIIENDYFKSFDAKLLKKPINLDELKSALINLS